MRRLAVLLTFLFVAGLAVYGCGDDDNNNPTPAPGTPSGQLRLRLTDAPADFDSIVLGITEIGMHRAGDSTWLAFTPSQRVVDVLTLRNGVYLDLGTFTVATGTVDSIRLMLDSTSHVVSNGVSQPIVSDTSGGVVPTSLTVTSGTSSDIGMDFEAVRSLQADGAGGWTFVPSIRVLPFSGTGSITGTLSPGDSLAAIYALAGADTMSSTLNTPTGDFALTLLPAGTYDVLVYGAINQRDTTITGVVVTAGQATSLGTIPMAPLGQQMMAHRRR